MKPRHATLINNFAQNVPEEEKVASKQIKTPQREINITKSKDSTVLPTYRGNPSTIGETDLRMSMSRDPTFMFDSSNFANEIGREEVPLDRRFTTLNTNSNSRVIRSINSNQNTIQMPNMKTGKNTLRLKRAWEDRPSLTSITSKEQLTKVEKEPPNYSLGSPSPINKKLTKRIKLPTLTSSAQPVYINEVDEELEEGKEIEDEVSTPLLLIQNNNLVAFWLC